MSLGSYVMCFEGSGRLMEEKKSYKAVRHIDSVIFAVALSFMHLFSCLCLQYFNALSTQSSLSALCRTGEGKIKGLKRWQFLFEAGLILLIFFLVLFPWSSQSGPAA